MKVRGRADDRLTYTLGQCRQCKDARFHVALQESIDCPALSVLHFARVSFTSYCTNDVHRNTQARC